ncbi:TetR-like C-terminal domain-containing protein [Streptomyces sp. Rer75]|uniref:TetR-like C-terminal domain-containing protein n=1 Tax=Streptomyces sp. Rer75 TaxID=2750011 RepID=UPI0015D01DFD|nr:TetR-like C-terminal domain-containing protein [Streptomyces sp. Rer75]QLH23035.1 TetR/AcrR family transcriptional regulator C-terminal ligand-binding domain-containing protein [Streptomyces sp. Rer75]
MNARPPHGSARPGGRTARTRVAVLAAAYDALGAESFSALTLDKLAERSGVHVSTIRRRWRTVEGVVLDLLAERSATLPTPDSGDFRRDLHELSQAIGDFTEALRNRNVIQGLLAAAAHDPRVEEIVRGAFVGRTEQVTRIVRHAIDRGELPADTDAKDVIAALGAPFYYRVLILRGAVDARLVRTSAEAAYHAARAGVFGAGPDGE